MARLSSHQIRERQPYSTRQPPNECTWDLSVQRTTATELFVAMSGLEIAAGIVTFVSASRKVADGISRLSGLRHAPDVLLALNNELADLQCVLVSHSDRAIATVHTSTLLNDNRRISKSWRDREVIRRAMPLHQASNGQFRILRSFSWIWKSYMPMN